MLGPPTNSIYQIMRHEIKNAFGTYNKTGN